MSSPSAAISPRRRFCGCCVKWRASTARAGPTAQPESSPASRSGTMSSSHNYCRRLVRDYLIPMGGAIWSTPVDKMLEFPAENFVAFFDNHRLLHNERPVWRTVAGGSRNYVDKLTARFRGQLRLGAAVTAIERSANGVVIRDSLGHSRRATTRWWWRRIPIRRSPCSPTRRRRSAPSSAAIRYRPNDVYLHRDARLMPRRRKAWASWNFLRDNGRGDAGRRHRGHLLDEPAAGHRQRSAAFRQPQSALRAGARPDLRPVQLRASAIRCARLRRAEKPRP